jgi:hypothetical protein
MSTDLMQEERLFAALVRLAIKDAIQAKNEQLREEAIAFLWWFAPTIAERGLGYKSTCCERFLVGSYSTGIRS